MPGVGAEPWRGSARNRSHGRRLACTPAPDTAASAGRSLRFTAAPERRPVSAEVRPCCVAAASELKLRRKTEAACCALSEVSDHCAMPVLLDLQIDCNAALLWGYAALLPRHERLLACHDTAAFTVIRTQVSNSHCFATSWPLPA